MWINNREKEGIFIREILKDYILFLKKGILVWLECHLKLLIVCLKIVSMLMIDLIFYLFFVVISNNDLFASILYLIILVAGSFVSFFIDYVRGLRWLKEVC